MGDPGSISGQGVPPVSPRLSPFVPKGPEETKVTRGKAVDTITKAEQESSPISVTKTGERPQLASATMPTGTKVSETEALRVLATAFAAIFIALASSAQDAEIQLAQTQKQDIGLAQTTLEQSNLAIKAQTAAVEKYDAAEAKEAHMKEVDKILMIVMIVMIVATVAAIAASIAPAIAAGAVAGAEAGVSAGAGAAAGSISVTEAATEGATEAAVEVGTDTSAEATTQTTTDTLTIAKDGTMTFTRVLGTSAEDEMEEPEAAETVAAQTSKGADESEPADVAAEPGARAVQPEAAIEDAEEASMSPESTTDEGTLFDAQDRAELNSALQTSAKKASDAAIKEALEGGAKKGLTTLTKRLVTGLGTALLSSPMLVKGIMSVELSKVYNELAVLQASAAHASSTQSQVSQILNVVQQAMKQAGQLVSEEAGGANTAVQDFYNISSAFQEIAVNAQQAIRH